MKIQTVHTPAALGMLVALSLGFSAFSLSLIPAEASAQVYSITNGRYNQQCCNLIPSFIFNTFPFAGGGGGVPLTDGAGGTSIPVDLGSNGTLMFDASAFGYAGAFTNTWPGGPPVPGWISAMTSVNFKNGQATLAPGGLTGSAGYCVNYAGNPNCTDPADGGTLMGQTLNGVISFNHPVGTGFGGTLRILGSTPGYLYRTDGGPSVRRKGNFVGPLSEIGGPFTTGLQPDPQTASFFSPPFPNPTPFNTTYMYQVFVGMPWGTGMAYGIGTGGNPPFGTQSFSGSGYDNRTAMGVGNIQMVSALLVTGVNPFLTLLTMKMTVPEPGTTAMLAGGIGLTVLLGLYRRRA